MKTTAKTITIKTNPLFQWQRDVVSLYDTHPLNSIISIKSPRQRGKTYTIMIIALRECINNSNNTVIIICPTFSICRKQFKSFEKAVKHIPVVSSLNSSNFEIEFTNGSIIKFKSAESGNNLRGETANLLIFDEGAFIDLETALECFNYTNTTNGNIMIFSTPTFKDTDNLFYRYYLEGLNERNNCYSLDWCDYDTSDMLSNEKLEMYRSTMPLNVFKNEILGEFLSYEGSVFGNFTDCIGTAGLLDNNVICGIDFATGVNGDETAVSIFNSRREMVGLYHFNDKDSIGTIEYIKNLFVSYNIRKAVVEVNSIGKVFYDLLREEVAKNHIHTHIVGFTTSNTSKREIIQDLQLHIQNKTIKLLDEPMLKLQFASFEMKSTPSGLITYGNSSDRIHDDIVMSVALALNGFKTGNFAYR